MTDSGVASVSGSDFVDPNGSIVESAQLFANHVCVLLESDATDIEISFVGMKGLTSSYFNLLLRLVLQTVGVDGFQSRIQCRFDSPLQESVFQRSWETISKEAA